MPVPLSPEASVVLPVWNGARFLADAIESVLAQTFRAFELIIVDDGSTDGTAAIAEAFAVRDPRVVVLRRPHEGLSHSLNAAIAVARGRWIARMDADDVSRPDRLALQLDYLRRHPRCVVVGSWIEVFDDAGRYVGTKTFVQNHGEIVAAFVRGISPIAHPTVVAKRDAVIAAGGYDPSFYPSEDLDLWLRISEFGELANLRAPLVRHRRHAAAISIVHSHMQIEATAAIVNARRRFLGLSPLQRRVFLAGPDRRARYHFECARTALIAGPRRVAVRHAAATIRREPRRFYGYAMIAACVVPKRILRLMLEARARLRQVSFP